MQRLGSLRRAAITLPLTLVALGFGACGGGDGFPPVTSPGVESGVPPRTVSDADFRTPTGADAADADNDAGDADNDASNDARDGGDAGDALPMLRIEIKVTAPMTGGVAPAQIKFTPAVDVLVDSPDGSASDTLKDVGAEVVDARTKQVVASGKLNQVGFHQVPETTQLVYNFAESPIDLASVPSGNYELVITATTNGGTAVKQSQAFQIDAGPAIRINGPIKDKAYKGSAPIDVTISDDYFGPVSDVSMKVGQTSITFAGPGGASGYQYTSTLDFASFMPALEGEQILTVRAKNKNGTESVQVLKFISDSVGPVFANAKPKDGDLVGNVIGISVELSDPAGVLPSSVVAVFANGPGSEYTIPLRAPVSGDPNPAYSAVFDTRLLPFGENALFPTLSFRASDNLGNESLLTNVVWLDNRPPLADLDPPDMRIWTKTDSGLYGCSWPFDPVGADAADDTDIVPQITTIRARIEDQGNDPLSGRPNYIPIAAVDTVQLLVLDDISQPLVVNTNPVVVGNKKADDLCDAINPNLIPTTRPMTAKDALLVTLTPIAAGGSPDLTNGLDPNDQTMKVGDERSASGDDAQCTGSLNAKAPDSVCEVSRTWTKAKWAYWGGFGWIPHNDAINLFLGYTGGGGAAGRLPSIWTIPKQEAGQTNLLCGGTQLDTLANFVNDGWACLAIYSTDKLGNKQVSRPFRLCVDKDADGKECPHKPIASVLAGTPLIVQTVADHGYATGDKVHVSGVQMFAVVNGEWTITVLDAKTFSLDGTKIPAGAPVSSWSRPGASGSNPFIPGHVVKLTDVPNCTGTVTATTPNLVIDGTQSCKPWRQYPVGEMRVY